MEKRTGASAVFWGLYLFRKNEKKMVTTTVFGL